MTSKKIGAVNEIKIIDMKTKPNYKRMKRKMNNTKLI